MYETVSEYTLGNIDEEMETKFLFIPKEPVFGYKNIEIV